MSPRRIRRIVLATALVAAALPAAASADTRIAQTAVTDPTGGATATVELWQRSSDGAVYPKVTVHDIRADNVCAHGSVNWKHESGNTYFDTGMYACGAGASKSYTKGARNWRSYDSVSISASVDNGPVASAPLHAFSSSPGGGTGRLGPRRTGGKCDSTFMKSAVAKNEGLRFKVSFVPTWQARSYGRFGLPRMWEDLRTCAPFPPLKGWQVKSLWQQLMCHAFWAPTEKTGGGKTWDLEGWLAPVSAWQVTNPAAVAKHECNWKARSAEMWS